MLALLQASCGILVRCLVLDVCLQGFNLITYSTIFMSVVVLIVPFILKNMFNSLHFLKHKFRIVLVTHILGKVYNLGRAGQ